MIAITLAAIAIAIAPLAPVAYAADSNQTHAYLTDRNGRPVEVRTGGCLRSRYWTNSRMDPHCKATIDKMKVNVRQ